MESRKPTDEDTIYNQNMENEVLNQLEQDQHTDPITDNNVQITKKHKNEETFRIFGEDLEEYNSDDEDVPEDLKNKFEKAFPMNKRALIERLKDFNSSESTLNPGKWETKMNEGGFTMSFKNKGTEISKNHPLIKSEMLFPAYNTVERVIKSVHNPEERLAWDKDVENGEIMKVQDKYILWYQLGKSSI